MKQLLNKLADFVKFETKLKEENFRKIIVNISYHFFLHISLCFRNFIKNYFFQVRKLLTQVNTNQAMVERCEECWSDDEADNVTRSSPTL